MSNDKTVAVEEDASGQTKNEREKTYYAEIVSLKELFSVPAEVEEQEQWEIKLAPTDQCEGGRFRVRKTVLDANGQIEYVQTIKINEAGSQVGDTSVAETSFPVSEDVFLQFKRLASSGMIKTRRTVQLVNEHQQRHCIEIDLFKSPEGKIFNWCKIDYEYTQDHPDTPSFPPGLGEIIDGSTTDVEQQAFIRELYSTAFLAKKNTA